MPELKSELSRLGFTKIDTAKKIAYLGDSITFVVGDTRCYSAWASFLTKQRLEVVNVTGYSGQNTAYIAANAGPAVNSGADVVVVLAGANDIAGTNTLESVYAAYQSLHDKIKAAGAWPVFIAPFPRNDATAAQNLRTWEMGDFLRGMSLGGTCDFIDGAVALANSMSTILPGYTYDGIHPNKLGGYLLGSLVADYINKRFPVGRPNSKRGSANKVPNPFFTGTGGAKYDLATGTMPSRWGAQLTGAQSASAVCSVVQDAPLPRNIIRVALEGVDGSDSYLSISASATPGAGRYFFEYEARVSGNLNIQSFNARAQSWAAPTFAAHFMNDPYVGSFLPATDLEGVVRSEAFDVAAGQEVWLYIALNFRGGRGVFEATAPRLVLAE